MKRLQSYNVMQKEFENFIATTERSSQKIEESVVTLLYVVQKESDILFRKKEQTQAQAKDDW